MGLLRSIAWSIGGGLIGYMAWMIPESFMWLSVSIFIFWLSATSRIQAFGATFTYYLIASLPIAPSLQMFFDNGSWLVYLLVAVMAFFLSLPWAILWRKKNAWWNGVLLCVLITLPPLGIVSMYSPLFGLGQLLPGFGWWAFALLGLSIALSAKRRWIFPLILVPSALMANMIFVEPEAPKDWVTVDTSVITPGFGSDGDSFMSDFQNYQTMFKFARKNATAKYLLFPESFGGLFGETQQQFFEAEFQSLADRGQTIVYGAFRKEKTGAVNGIVGRGAENFFWEQRYPPPAAMWRPWDAENSFRARFDGPQTMALDGRQWNMSICYESSILWPLLQSSWNGANAYLVIGNLRWGHGTALDRQGRAMITAWARLFSLPSVSAINN